MGYLTHAAFLTYQGEGSDILQKLIIEAHDLFCEAEEKGLKPNTPDMFMVDVNMGHRSGFTTSEMFSRLDRAVDTLENLENGTTTARKVVGKHGTKVRARKWLVDQIKECALAVRFSGFFECVNICNYRRSLYELLKTSKDLTENGVTHGI